MRSSLSYSFADFRRKERAGSSNFENLKLIGGDAFIAKRLQKNPVRKRTYVRRRGFPLMLPQHGCHYNVVAIRKAQKGCHAAAPSFCFLLVSYVLLRFSKFLLFRFKKSFVTSLRFFAPSLLGTSSLRADVAASVGDNFFCVNLKKFVCKRAYRVLLRSLRPSLEESSRSRCSPPAPPLARDAIACSALEERAVYFISLSRRTLSSVSPL